MVTVRVLLGTVVLAVLSSCSSARLATQDRATSTALGALDGAFSVSNGGAATYTIPIKVTPGRLGIQPTLSLKYDSRGGDGIMGRGWSLEGLSSIRRCPKSVAQNGVRDGVNLTADDALCYDDQPLVGSNTQDCGQGREFRTLSNPFDRICAIEPGTPGNPRSFEVFRKDGNVAQYRDAAVGAVQTPNGLITTAWPITRLADRRGNAITFSYRTADEINRTVSGGALDPERDPAFSIVSINYVGHSTLAAERSVQFRYQARPDPITGFVRGAAVKVAYRLSSIDVHGPDDQVAHRYVLTYEERGQLLRLSRLVAVGLCDAGGVCLPPTTFEWAAEQSLTYRSPQGDGPVKALNLQDFTRFHVPIFANALASGTGQLFAKQRFVSGWLWQLLWTDGAGTLRMTPQFQWPGTIERLVLVDFDGDGRKEILKLKRREEPQQRWTYVLWRADANAFARKLAEGVLPIGGPFDMFSVGDFDGNGDEEILVRTKPYGSSQYTFHVISAASDLTTLQVTPTGLTRTGRIELEAVLDPDGDGRDEVVFKDFRNYYLIEQTPDGRWTIRQESIEQGATSFWVPRFGLVLDANGDGYDDILVPDEVGTLTLWVNTGRRFVRAATLETRGSTLGTFANAGSLKADLDGDGRDELLLFKRNAAGEETIAVFFWNGTGLEMRDLELRLADNRRPDLRGRYEVLTLADLTDDGIHEIIDSQRRMFVREGTRGGVITAIRSGLQHERRPAGTPPDVHIEYAWASRKNVYTAAAPADCGAEQVCGTPAIYLVRRVEFGNGVPGAVKQVEYTYRDARFDRRGRGFLGFREIVENDIATGLQRTTTADNRTFLRALHVYAYAAQPESVTEVASTATETLTRSVRRSFQSRMINGGRSFLTFTVARVDTQKRQADPGELQTVSEVLETKDVDDFGNVTRSERVWRTNPEHIVRSLPNLQWLSELLSLERIGPYERVDRTYINDQRGWLIGLLTRQEVLSRSALCEYVAPRSTPVPPGVTLPRWYQGGGCPEGGEARRLTQVFYGQEDGRQDLVERIEEQGHNAAAKLTIAFRYDQFGNVVEETASGPVDEAGSVQLRRREIAFDSREHAFAVKETNAAGHVLSRTYDPTLGVELTRDGPLGLTSYVVDGFARVVTATHAGGDRVQVAIGRADATASMRVDVNRATGPRALVTLDMLGRPSLVQSVGFEGDVTNAARLIQQQRSYDEAGRLTLEEFPHFNGEDVDAIERQFDAFGRVTDEFGRDGRTHTEHDGLVARVTNARDEMTVYVRNAAGRLVASIDPTGKASRYYYGSFGRLWRAYDAEANLYAIDYDALGRQSALRYPDYGSQRFLWNAFGEVIRSSNASGAVSRFAYDELGRVIRRLDAPSESAPASETLFEWDRGSGRGVGRLASTRGPDGQTERFEYDEFGRLKQYTVALGTSASAPSYRIGLAYDEFGRLVRIDYPAVDARAVAVGYEYDRASGFLKVIKDQAGRAVWTAQGYDAGGRLGDEIYGNGIRTARSYWRRSGRAHQMTSARSAQPPLQALAFSYWAGGSVFERQMGANTGNGSEVHRNEVASYDQLERLETVDDLQLGRQTLGMQYDSIGRTTWKSDVGAFTYDPQRPHAVTRAGTQTFTYNANGEMTLRNGAALTYTPSGRLATAGVSGGQIQFGYTARQQRLTKQTPASQTTYVGGKLFALRRSTGTPPSSPEATVRIPGPGGRIVAEFASTGAGRGAQERRRYLLSDNLGSVTAVTDDAGNVTARWTYDPYGRRVAVGSSACVGCELGFTGHLYDEELGLIDAGARHYDPAIGQFLSPDPVIGPSSSTQSLHPYAYAYNNPLSFVDPTGRQPEDVSQSGGEWCSVCNFPDDTTFYFQNDVIIGRLWTSGGAEDAPSPSAAEGDGKEKRQSGGVQATLHYDRTERGTSVDVPPPGIMYRDNASYVDPRFVAHPSGVPILGPKAASQPAFTRGWRAERVLGVTVGDIPEPLRSLEDPIEKQRQTARTEYELSLAPLAAFPFLLRYGLLEEGELSRETYHRLLVEGYADSLLLTMYGTMRSGYTGGDPINPGWMHEAGPTAKMIEIIESHQVGRLVAPNRGTAAKVERGTWRGVRWRP